MKSHASHSGHSAVASVRTRSIPWLLSIGLGLVACSQAGAVTLTLVESDGPGETSFLPPVGHWGSGPPLPPAGNDYVVSSGMLLRTPVDTGNAVFPGDSLRLDEGATLGLTMNSVGRTVVSDLRVNDGRIVNARAGSDQYLDGVITADGVLYFDALTAGRRIIVEADIEGPGNIVIGPSGGVVVFSGSNLPSVERVEVSAATLSLLDGTRFGAPVTFELGPDALLFLDTSAPFTLEAGQSLTGEGAVLGELVLATDAVLSPGYGEDCVFATGNGTINVPDASGGPYSQSVSNLDDNGIVGVDMAGAGGDGDSGCTDLIEVEQELTIGLASILSINVQSTLDDLAYVFMTYGSLSGRFGVVEGLPDDYDLVYGYNSMGAIALVRRSGIDVPPTLALLGFGSLLLALRARSGRRGRRTSGAMG